MNKTANVDEVITHFRDGMTIMFGGFGGVGSPSLIDAILEANIKRSDIDRENDAGFRK
ncbi:CoA-transferase [Bacillus pumilus]|nr:CoA-transferase [Bacillus pumilus]